MVKALPDGWGNILTRDVRMCLSTSGIRECRTRSSGKSSGEKTKCTKDSSALLQRLLNSFIAQGSADSLDIVTDFTTVMDRIFRRYYKMNGSNAFSPLCSVVDPIEQKV